MIIRPYQQEAIDATRIALRTCKSVLLQLPTGGGKTAVAAWIAREASRRRSRVMFACHRRELVDQTHGAFRDVGLRPGVIAPGHKPNRLPVQIASIPSLRRRLETVQAPDVLFIDEAHHVAAAGWAAIMDAYPNALKIGLSATPQRLDGRGLHPWFDEIVRGPSVEQLIADGWLADYRMLAPAVPDTSSLHTRAGDYSQEEVSVLMDQADLIGDIVTHWQGHAEGKKTIAFATNVAHSMHIVDEFKARGVKAAHIDGKTPDKERRMLLRAFALGGLDVISNCQLFGEGYDLAANAGINVTVDCVIDAAPTQSLTLCLQRWGRALRPKEDSSKAVLLDHAGNCMRHGFPDDDREWTLADRVKQKKAEASGPAIKRCPQCYHCHRPGVKACPACNFVYPVAENLRPIVHREGILKEVRRRPGEADKDFNKRLVKAQKTYPALVEVGRRLGYKRPERWAQHTLEHRAKAYARHRGLGK